MKFYKRYFSPLVEEEFIDMGIITSKEVTHRYYLKVENRFGKPAVITQVSVNKHGGGMVFRVGTMFGYKVVLPPSGPAFDLLVLYAQADDKFDLGYVWGTISIYVDVSGQQEIIIVPFQACYFYNLFADEDRVSFELKRNVKDGKIINRLDGFFKNNYLTDIVIHDMTFVDFESNKNAASFTSLTRNRRLSPGDASKAFAAQFIFQESYFDNTFSRGYEVANVRALGTFGSVLVQYYTMNLMCGLHNAISSVYEKCKNIEKLEFAYVAVGHRKVMTMDIYNPTMVSYMIKRIEFSTNSGNIEISFENQSRNGLRSYFKKASKTMNTFVLLPRNDVVSLRVKIKPRETGSFKETVSIYTNHGEFSLSIVYKGIQGEILFIPTTLRYDLFYPIESDEKQVAARNKFNIEVRISNAWSPQSYIFANLRQFSLKENSKETFLGVILDLTDDEVLETERSGFLRTFNDHFVTLSDLVSLEDQIVGWDKILREAKTEISGEVIVQTDLLSDMKINVKGFIRKALFVPEDKVVVGPLEEKRSHFINITLHNPTERDVTMRFYIADPRMTDLKAIHKKVLRRLKKKYAKYQKEQVCLIHGSFDEEAIKYYANSLFDGVTIKSVGLSKNNKKKICFQVNNPKPIHDRFYTHKGNYVFNSTRLSRKNIIRDNMDVYVLKDVVKLSNRKPPANPQSLYSLSFYKKLQMIFAHMKVLIKAKFKKTGKLRSKGNTKFISSLKKEIFDTILQKQEFFINPKYRNKKIILPAGQSQTIPAVICHPQGSGDLKINLLIKNDYSNLIILPITAQLGKVSLIVYKVIYFNEGATTSIVLKKEEYHKMIFSISSADLFQKLGSTKDSKKLFFKKNVKRVFELKNNGNLPIKVNSISVDKQGCTFNGFKIVNCMAFELGPGQTHRLEVMLLNTYDFQSEFKREVYFLMESRVFVLEFEVRTMDPLMADLSSYGYVSSISHIFKLVVLIFMIILGLILYKHYHDKQSELGYYVTDLERLRFGNNLYFDNIFDLKVLEANVKYQKLEAQKNRMIRAVGLKELMTNNLKENNSKDHSIISEQPEEKPADVKPFQEPSPHHYKKESEIIDREPELILLPAKGKKNKRPKKPSATATPVKVEQQEMHHEIHNPTDNILDPIKNEIEERKPEPIPIYRKEEHQAREAIQYREIREAREREAREAKEARDREAREAREKELREREAKESQFNTKRHRPKKSYEPQSEEEEYYQKKESTPKESPSAYNNPLEKSKASDKSLSKPSKRQLSVKSDNDSIGNIEKPEGAGDKKRKGSGFAEKKVSPPTSTPRKTSLKNRDVLEPVEQVSVKSPELPLLQSRQESRKNLSEKLVKEPEVVKPTPSEVPEPVREQSQTSERRREGHQSPLTKPSEKVTDRGRARKKDLIYYQRVNKPQDDSEEASLTDRERVQAGLPNLSVKEESTGTAISSQAAAVANYPNSAPKLHPGSIHALEPSRVKRPSPMQPAKMRLHPNKSFSQEGDEEQHQDHRSFDRFNQTINDISEIVNAEENASNTSNIMLLKEHNDDRDRPHGDRNKTSPPHINVEDSDDSVDNLEKSHEKIRKLMEDTEEVVINEDIEERRRDVQLRPKIVGVIGGEKKKDTSNPSSRVIGSNFLGFRQSENNMKPPSHFMGFGLAPDLKPKSQELLPIRPSQLPKSHNQPLGSEEKPRKAVNPQSTAYSPYYSTTQPQPTALLDIRTKQPVQFKTYHNPYGTFVTRDVQPQQATQQPKPTSYYQEGYYPKGNEYGQFYHSASGSYGYDNEEGNEKEEGYPLDEEGHYYDAYDEAYYGGGSDGAAYPTPQGGSAGFDNKQFKAAMNNPFTLRNLAGGKGETQPAQQNYLGWMNSQNSYSQGEEDYEKPSYSASSYTNPKAGSMKAPPGLSNEMDSPAEEALPHLTHRTLEKEDDSEEPVNRQDSKLKLKRQDKPKYNMFG